MEPMIQDLALILVVAAAMTLLFKKLKQPLVLGYIVAGFLVSPNMPYMSSVTDLDNIHLWSDIGVNFLLFALGLEFSFKKIMKMGISPLLAAGTTIFFMMLLGFLVGSAFGWGKMDCVFLGGMLAMSSTTIIFKAFDDMGLRQQRFAGIVLSVLIIEDILAIVMMVVLSTLSVSSSVEGGELFYSISLLVFFIILWFIVGIFLVPIVLRKLKSLLTDEILLIVSLGLCFGMVVYASKVGFSAAFGAFVMGSILAETLEAEHIAKLVDPIKNLFGAVFFVSVGMMVNVELIWQYIIPIVCLILTVMLGQMIFGSASYLISGQNLKTSIQCGFSMTQIGEFAFILATLGTSLHVTSDFLYPIVVAVSVFTTFTTPYMIRLATPAYKFIESHLSPKTKQFLDKYTSGTPRFEGKNHNWNPYIKQVLKNVIIYFVLNVAVISIMLYYIDPLVCSLLPFSWNHTLCAVATLILDAPFIRALVMRQYDSPEARNLWFSTIGFNRVAIVAIMLARGILGAFSVGYILAHFTTLGTGMLIFFVLVIIIPITFSSSLKKRNISMENLFTENFHQREKMEQRGNTTHHDFEGELIERNIHIQDFTVPVGIEWAGKSLHELNFGQKYHIHVVAITRGAENMVIPHADTLLIPGDHVQIMGTDENLNAFGTILNDMTNQAVTPNTGKSMLLRRFIISENSSYDGKTILDSNIRKDFQCMIVGVEIPGQEKLCSPVPNLQLHASDILWLVGEPSNLLRIKSVL